MRLQEYGVGIFVSAFTKSALKKALKKNLITVNGDLATSATMISGGEHIELTIEEKVSPKKQLILPLKVIFEDDHLAVIHKPSGVLVSGNGFITVANGLAQNLKTSPLADATLPQPVHRLDFATTGVLLVGKTASAIRQLNKLFEDKKIKKTYFAVTIGEMDSEGRICSAIEGKKCESEYLVQQSVPSKRFGTLNLVKLHPHTGRRHQLRIHLSSIGKPILGDKDYGIEGLILKGKGMYLHAHSLEFVHPFTAEKVRIEDPLPEKFRKLFVGLD
ncbi:MAG: RluA family pseudouridine synthase [Flavobacteriales bacterium]